MNSGAPLTIQTWLIHADASSAPRMRHESTVDFCAGKQIAVLLEGKDERLWDTKEFGYNIHMALRASMGRMQPSVSLARECSIHFGHRHR